MNPVSRSMRYSVIEAEAVYRIIIGNLNSDKNEIRHSDIMRASDYACDYNDDESQINDQDSHTQSLYENSEFLNKNYKEQASPGSISSRQFTEEEIANELAVWRPYLSSDCSITSETLTLFNNTDVGSLGIWTVG